MQGSYLPEQLTNTRDSSYADKIGVFAIHNRIISSSDSANSFKFDLRANSELISRISLEIKSSEISHTLFSIGSSVQSLLYVEESNFLKNFRSYLKTLQELAFFFNGYFFKSMLCDIFSGHPPGYAANQLINTLNELFNQIKYPGIDDDEMTMVIYSQIHEISIRYPGKKIYFYLYHHDEEVIIVLHEFFKFYPSLLPKNATLKLEKYTYGFSQVQTISLEGKGEIDYGYQDTIKDFATFILDGRFAPNSTPSWKTYYLDNNIYPQILNSATSLIQRENIDPLISRRISKHRLGISYAEYRRLFNYRNLSVENNSVAFYFRRTAALITLEDFLAIYSQHKISKLALSLSENCISDIYLLNPPIFNTEIQNYLLHVRLVLGLHNINLHGSLGFDNYVMPNDSEDSQNLEDESNSTSNNDLIASNEINRDTTFLFSEPEVNSNQNPPFSRNSYREIAERNNLASELGLIIGMFMFSLPPWIGSLVIIASDRSALVSAHQLNYFHRFPLNTIYICTNNLIRDNNFFSRLSWQLSLHQESYYRQAIICLQDKALSLDLVNFSRWILPIIAKIEDLKKKSAVKNKIYPLVDAIYITICLLNQDIRTQEYLNFVKKINIEKLTKAYLILTILLVLGTSVLAFGIVSINQKKNGFFAVATGSVLLSGSSLFLYRTRRQSLRYKMEHLAKKYSPHSDNSLTV